MPTSGRCAILRQTLAVAAAGLLGACQAEPAFDAANNQRASPPPAQICEDAREALEALRESAAFVYDQSGEATIDDELWLGIPAGAREQLAQSLAFHASCSAGASSDAQRVVVRGTAGTLIMERTLDTTPTIDLE